MKHPDRSISFSIVRFMAVLNRFFVFNQKNWVIGLLGAAGLVFSMWMLPVLFLDGPVERIGFRMIEGTAMFFYVAGGLVLTSRIFFELHSSNTSFQFLTLPASTFEKFSAAWLISSVGYTAVAVAVIFLLSILIESISALKSGIWDNFRLFNPFETDNRHRFASYMFYHSVFLLGAIYFRKNNFLKTLLVIITFFIGLFFIIAIAGLILSFMMFTESFSFEYQLIETAAIWQSFLTYLIGIFLIALFLLSGYLQLKNKQVA
jgi:hypothetical protein